MDLLYDICVALSVGVLVGMLGGALRMMLRKKPYTEKETAGYQKVWKTGSRILTFATALLLLLGLIWCVYFLVLGLTAPAQAEYASAMSQLIVSALTVISIMFAFYEFIRRK